MRVKKLVLLLLVLAVSIAFMGCDMINGAFDSIFLNVTEVEAADLEDYSTSYDPVGNEDDVDIGFGLALEALGSESASRLIGEDAAEALTILKYSSPELASLFGTADSASRALSAGANVSITDELIEDGDTTIDITEISFDGNLDLDDMDEPTEASVDFSFKAELGLSDVEGYDYDVYGAYTVADSKINFNANGNGDAALDSSGEPTSISYYLGFDLSLGFTLELDGYAGKYIVNVKYVNSADWTSSSTSLTGGESVTVDVIAYDNSGTEIATKTYTAEEFFEVSAGSVPSTI